MNATKQNNFLGTYFKKDAVLRLASFARILSWIMAGFYILQWLIQMGTISLQIERGFWAGMGITDIVQNIYLQFEQPLHGLVFFAALQGLAQLLLMFMDIEDNTRRAARGGK